MQIKCVLHGRTDKTRKGETSKPKKKNGGMRENNSHHSQIYNYEPKLDTIAGRNDEIIDEICNFGLEEKFAEDKGTMRQNEHNFKTLVLSFYFKLFDA